MNQKVIWCKSKTKTLYGFEIWQSLKNCCYGNNKICFIKFSIFLQ